MEPDHILKINRMAEETERKKELPMINNEIEFRNLSFAYSEKPVFENLNLKFKVGVKYGIIEKRRVKNNIIKILLGQLTSYSENYFLTAWMLLCMIQNRFIDRWHI
ncbi:MAG: hypothetical protein ACLUUO_15310 [Sellimonas intestinalis]